MKCVPAKTSPVLASLLAAFPLLVSAAPTPTSAYVTDPQWTRVEDATSKGIGQVNMIACLMAAMRPDALVNQGNYIALVDQSVCDSDSRASASNSGSSSSGASAATYMTALLNSTRTSNDDPMRAKIWIDESHEGRSETIFIHTAATQAPSESNPYGIFRVDFCGRESGGASASCTMNGFLEGSAAGITYFEVEAGDGGGGGGGGGSNTVALQLTTGADNTGSGALSMSRGGTTQTFSFAYNEDHFRRSDGTDDQCFTRDASDPDTGMSVWRYGLYDAATGDRVTRNSGFPIEIEGPSGSVHHGHMGYWGLWLPGDIRSSVTDGATVQRVEYGEGAAPTKTSYTLSLTAGRLMKYTKKTRLLNSMDKLKFQTWVNDASSLFSGALNNTNYEMYWDDAAGTFKVAGTVQCGQNGCITNALSPEPTVSPSFFSTFGGVHGWSQALGGEVYIPVGGPTLDSAAVSVVYREQDLVYPSNMPANLYCLRDCPTAATISSFFAPSSVAMSPFTPTTFNNWMPTDSGSAVTYSTAGGMLKDGANQDVAFTDVEALATRPQFQSGVRTGRLFTTLTDAQCHGDPSHLCDNKVNELDVYYQWETGPNQWNQFAGLKDGTGAFVAFDAPLQLNYTVPSGSAYGPYAGKTLVLQYGGYGDLSGIPGHCVSHTTNATVSCETSESRYVPAFVIPYDATLGQLTAGSNTYLAKWLDREIRFARKSLSACTAQGLDLPSGITLPTAAQLKDPSDPASDVYVGVKPTVTAAPRVIHGEVKY